jgi:hypothetical protein
MSRTVDELFETSFRVNEPQVVSEEFDGEFVILNLSSGTYYSLQASGNALWAAVTAGVAPRRILQAMEAAGNAQAPSVRSFLERMIELDLVRPDVGRTASTDAHLVAQLATIDTAPAVEVFDDLADLILADPVHEADKETGWPAKPISN